MSQFKFIWFFALVVGIINLFPVSCFAKGEPAPLVFSGTVDDLKVDGSSVSFLYTGKIFTSGWAQQDRSWEYKASVSKLPVKVARTVLSKNSHNFEEFTVEQEQSRAKRCLREMGTVHFAISNPILYFGQLALSKIEGDEGRFDVPMEAKCA